MARGHCYVAIYWFTRARKYQSQSRISARGFAPPIVRSSLRLLGSFHTGADTDSW